MKYEIYSNLTIADDFNVVDFISEGVNGSIPKRIILHETEWEQVYNLAFGDIDAKGEIDDRSISNNGDRDKILATVAGVIKDYTKRFPERVIFFSGSTAQRTRLYRRALTVNYEELSSEFDIYCYQDGAIVPFSGNIKSTGVFVKRKMP